MNWLDTMRRVAPRVRMFPAPTVHRHRVHDHLAVGNDTGTAGVMTARPAIVRTTSAHVSAPWPVPKVCERGDAAVRRVRVKGRYASGRLQILQQF